MKKAKILVFVVLFLMIFSVSALAVSNYHVISSAFGWTTSEPSQTPSKPLSSETAPDELKDISSDTAYQTEVTAATSSSGFSESKPSVNLIETADPLAVKSGSTSSDDPNNESRTKSSTGPNKSSSSTKKTTSTTPSSSKSSDTASSDSSSSSEAVSSNPAESAPQGGSGSQPQSISITKVTLNESALSMIKGDTATLKATVAPAGTTQSKTVTWSSSDTSVATVDSDGAVTAVEGGSAKITAKSVNGKTADCAVTVTVPATGIEINATPFEIDRGDSRTLTATVLPADATDKSVSWATSDSSVVSVDENGKITAEAPGAATITAATADGKYSASCAVNVIISISSLNLNKTTDTIIKGATDTLTATIDPPDTTENKTVTWTTTDPAVATVDSAGIVTAVEGGTTTITAQAGSHFAECVVTVVVPVTGISIFPDASIEKGTQQSLMVTFTPTDATDRAVTWSSSNPAVATVDEDGKITAVSVGSTAITATSHDGGFTATCNVSVVIHVTGITLDQSAIVLIKGNTQALTATVQPADATDKSLLWSSSNPDVAMVDSTGVVTAVEGGTATITAKSEDGGKTAQCDVTVRVPVTGVSLSKTTDLLLPGGADDLTAIIAPSDATDKAVVWSSSEPDAVTVDTDGNISAVSIGTAIITVKTHDGGFSASCNITVKIPVTGISLDKTSVNMATSTQTSLHAQIQPENATDKNIFWNSSNPSIATVNSQGVISALSVGSTTITATTEDGGFSASCGISVVIPVTDISLNQTTFNLLKGSNYSLSDSITPTDATNKNVLWAVSDPSVATVDQTGNVTALKAGTVTITATALGSITPVKTTCTVQVVDTVHFTVSKDVMTYVSTWIGSGYSVSTVNDQNFAHVSITGNLALIQSEYDLAISNGFMWGYISGIDLNFDAYFSANNVNIAYNISSGSSTDNSPLIVGFTLIDPQKSNHVYDLQTGNSLDASQAFNKVYIRFTANPTTVITSSWSCNMNGVVDWSNLSFKDGTIVPIYSGQS